MKTNRILLYSIACLLLSCSHSASNAGSPPEIKQVDSDNEYVQLSQNFINKVKQKADRSQLIQKIARINPADLAIALDTDKEKKAFFINLYNGFVQHILMQNPEKFEDRDKFFKSEQINLAGEMLSLDDIEHGIIRGSKVKWSLGILQDPFADDFEKDLRVSTTDPRIHFALNCGAKSCPYVAAYSAENLDQELDFIARQFLTRTSEYKPNEGKVYVTSLISWFRGDFDGLDGALEMLKKYGVVPQDANPELEFKDYDWTLELGNYTELDV